MNKEHLQTLIAVTVKANGAGIIQISDWPTVFAALQAAETEIKQMEAKEKPVAQGNAQPDGAPMKAIEKRFKRAK